MNPQSYPQDASLAKSARHRMRTADAAAYLGVSRSFLEKLRLSGDGPVYAKLGKTVVYESADLNAWADARKRASTSEQPNAA